MAIQLIVKLSAKPDKVNPVADNEEGVRGEFDIVGNLVAIAITK